MGFFRSQKDAAPGCSADLPWPIDGLAYVVMFLGGLSGGMAVGLQAAGAAGLGVGFIVGSLVTIANCLLFDWYLEARIGKLQNAARRPLARALINVAGFSWAIVLCALSVALTLALLYRIG